MCSFTVLEEQPMASGDRMDSLVADVSLGGIGALKEAQLDHPAQPEVGVAKLIPLDQILPDPHQPRTKFKHSEIVELATSIKNEGQQQAVTVNFAFHQDGKDFYYLKAGERRYRAHQHNKAETILCYVEPKAYDGKRNARRRLAQAAENSSRVPHAHIEIIEVVRDVVNDEIERRGTNYGSVKIAVITVAQAFGRSETWAENYHALTRLHPELAKLLDEDDSKKRLNFNVALSLCTAPLEEQCGLYDKAKPYLDKNFQLGLRYISTQAREIRSARGERVKGRQQEAINAIPKFVHRSMRSYEVLVGVRRSSEFKDFVLSALCSMTRKERDSLEHDLMNVVSGVKDLLDQVAEFNKGRKKG